jgi:hypothetical protein
MNIDAPVFAITRNDQHIYTVDGRIRPNVTSILEELYCFGGYNPDAAERGRLVHLYCQYYDENDLDLNIVREDLKPFVDAWVLFRNKNPLVIEWPMHCEQFCASKMGYAGQVDRVNDNWILDIKTGQPTPTHRHQLHAYNKAIIETYGGKRRQMGIVYLSADGKYREVIVRWDGKVWKEFEAAFIVNKFKNGGKI